MLQSSWWAVAARFAVKRIVSESGQIRAPSLTVHPVLCWFSGSLEMATITVAVPATSALWGAAHGVVQLALTALILRRRLAYAK